MAYIDKENARNLVREHKNFFSKLAIDNKDSLKDKVGKLVNQIYMIILGLKCGFIGLAWYFLANWNLFYGDLFLLLMTFIKTKTILDHEFAGIDDNILEAIDEIKLEETSNEEESEKEDGAKSS